MPKIRPVQKCLGIDFGTTNSAIAVANPDASIEMAHFRLNDQQTENFRSVLYFEQVREGLRKHVSAMAGPEAIMRYLESEQKGRLIQSLKSYLASRLLTSTTVLGRPYLLEELLSFLIRSLKEKSEVSMGDLGTRAVVGRPVRFSGAESKKDDEWAVARLRTAFSKAGFDDVIFEYEPIGAAYYYEMRLDHDELILVADFGGGTSDFSLLQVGPSFRRTTGDREIATDGVALAGDAFDAKIVRHLVSPLLGQASSYKTIDKVLPIPAWIYIKLERWHHLSFLKSKETMDLLKSLRVQSTEPDKIEALIHLVSEDLGFYLHSAVQRTKLELSAHEATTFSFQVPGISISSPVTREEFECWIKEELDAISQCVDGLLQRTGTDKKSIDKVFLTGGSSFVPAVRKIFAERFGAERLIVGDEFTSVAKGLALRALDLSDGR
jgi:hypothetical chaperone protein